MRYKFLNKIIKYAKKFKAIEKLGGKCECCGEDNFFKLDFHHKDISEKENSFNDVRYLRWSSIEKEISKCILLCKNCHMEHHFNENNLKNRRIKNKITFLNYKKEIGCERCGYNSCNASLDFHHMNKNDKDFEISKIEITYNSVNDLTVKIENELDKCVVLCKNCHSLEHSDFEFYDKYIDIIIDKSKNLKEIQSKIDRTIVKNMYENGIKQVDIAKHFSASKGTISGIIKGFKNN